MKKRKIYFPIIFLLFLNICFGQTISCTKVLYKMGKKEVVGRKINPDPEIEDTYNGLVKAVNKVECELFFTNEVSLFKIIEKATVDQDRYYKLASSSARGLYYKNLNTKEKINNNESFGETFNVILPFDQYAWEITTESKIISGYKCYKATSKLVEFSKIRNITNVFFPEVWFTPEIPASFGPQGLDGVPGLVLEGTISGYYYFYAVKINFDVQEPLAIFQKPKKGKFITQAEYKDFSDKAMEKLLSGKN